MKSFARNCGLIVFALFFTLLLSFCGTSEENSHIISSGSSTPPVIKKSTAMLQEPSTVAASATDSLIPDAKEETEKDSISAKIGVRKDKVKVVSMKAELD